MTREEAISRIENHIRIHTKQEPFRACYIQEALKMAIDALKVQEPRTLTVSEIGTLANGDVVWVEFTDGRLLPMMVEDGCLMRWRFLWRICEDAFYDEDYKARAWTSQPTDEQREATPWND